MRKLVLYMFTTLDGYMAGPNGELDFYEPTPQEMQYANETFGAADGIVFGRVVYGGFVEYWDTLDITDRTVPPTDVAFAKIFRSLQRIVVSKTLQAPDTNTIVISDNIAAQINALKQQPGKDLLLICGPGLLDTLMQYDLVDEFRLLVCPLLLGKGMSLFQNEKRAQLKLLDSHVFDSGVIMQLYGKA